MSRRGRPRQASRHGSCSRSRDGRDVGYVVFRRTHKWPNARPAAEVDVRPLSGGPAARLALLRRVVDLDLAGTVTVNGIAERRPLALVGAGTPRRSATSSPTTACGCGWSTCREALAARGYEADCDVVVEVADEPAPWNAGRWRIRVKDGAGEASRTDDDAEVSLPVAALGAAYLGGANLAEMQRAGVVAEHRPGAVRDLWRAFRTDLGPYAARGF